MTVTQFALLVLQGLFFGVWGFYMFKTLFRLRRRGAERTGRTFSGPGTFLTELRLWLTSPYDRKDRRRLLIAFIGLNLTTLLIATRIGI